MLDEVYPKPVRFKMPPWWHILQSSFIFRHLEICTGTADRIWWFVFSNSSALSFSSCLLSLSMFVYSSISSFICSSSRVFSVSTSSVLLSQMMLITVMSAVFSLWTAMNCASNVSFRKVLSTSWLASLFGQAAVSAHWWCVQRPDRSCHLPSMWSQELFAPGFGL